MRPANKPLRLPLQDSYKSVSIGTLPLATIKTGILKAGMIDTSPPSHVITNVPFLDMNCCSITSVKTQIATENGLGCLPINDINPSFISEGTKNDLPKEVEFFCLG
jgi:elongation factor 1-alpha